MQKQHYERFTEILAIGKLRYVEATGNQRGYRGAIKGQDYLMDEERRASLLLRQMFIMPSNDNSGNQDDLRSLPR